VSKTVTQLKREIATHLKQLFAHRLMAMNRSWFCGGFEWSYAALWARRLRLYRPMNKGAMPFLASLPHESVLLGFHLLAAHGVLWVEWELIRVRCGMCSEMPDDFIVLLRILVSAERTIDGRKTRAVQRVARATLSKPRKQRTSHPLQALAEVAERFSEFKRYA